MPQASGKIYVPPYSGVRLIEYRDHFQLVPVPAVRTVYGYGKVKASKATCDPDDPDSRPFWDDLGPDEDVWVVRQWYEYEDGLQEQGTISFLRPEVEEAFVRKRMEQMEEFASMTPDHARGLLQCHEAKQEDYDFVEDNFQIIKRNPTQRTLITTTFITPG
jgi:hypothetical protein